jgi:hypothetical protein
MTSTGRINVYVGKELRQAMRVEAVKQSLTLGEYIVSVFEPILNVKGRPIRQTELGRATKRQG